MKPFRGVLTEGEDLSISKQQSSQHPGGMQQPHPLHGYHSSDGLIAFASSVPRSGFSLLMRMGEKKHFGGEELQQIGQGASRKSKGTDRRGVLALQHLLWQKKRALLPSSILSSPPPSFSCAAGWISSRWGSPCWDLSRLMERILTDLIPTGLS